jgi:hypothetical protein
MNIRFPKRPRKDSDLGQWANDIQDALERMILQQGPNALLSRTTAGSFQVSDGGGGKGKGTGPVWLP